MLGRGVGFCRNQDAARAGDVLHAVGDVHIGARGVVALIDPVVDRLNNDLSGVHPDADLQFGVAEPLDLLLHRQRGEAAADGVVLVGPRRAK